MHSHPATISWLVTISALTGLPMALAAPMMGQTVSVSPMIQVDYQNTDAAAREQAYRAVLAQTFPAMTADYQLILVSELRDPDFGSSAAFRQYWEGVSIFGTKLLVHVNAEKWANYCYATCFPDLKDNPPPPCPYASILSDTTALKDSAKSLCPDYHAIYGAWQTMNGSNTAEDPQQIPPNYEQWKRDDDGDGHGFTYWEEYRGFMVGMQHIRTVDYLSATVFIDDVNGAIPSGSYAAFGTSSGYLPLDARWATCETYGDEREFIDCKSDKFCSGSWDANSLCDAGYDPPPSITRADQINVIVDYGPGWDPQHPFDIGQCWFVDNLSYWGLAAVRKTRLFSNLIYDQVVSWQASPHNLPPEGNPIHDYVHTQYVIRVVVHELGHAISIPHHSAGEYQGPLSCPMKYIEDRYAMAPDIPPGCYCTWESFVWGTGYCGECLGHMHIRPAN